MYQIYAYAYLDRVLIKNLVNGIDQVDTCFVRFFINILGHYKLPKIQGFVLSYNHSLFCLINIHDIIHACIFVLNVKLSLNICRNQIIFNDWNIHINRLFCSIFLRKNLIFISRLLSVVDDFLTNKANFRESSFNFPESYTPDMCPLFLSHKYFIL